MRHTTRSAAFLTAALASLVTVALSLTLVPPATAAGHQTGANDFRISEMGMDGIPYQNGILAQDPAVAYNATNDEYLVVWSGRDSGVYGTEIYGQIIAASTGFVVENDFRISRMGPDGNLFYNPQNPAVAWDSERNRYLVVWSSDDFTDEEWEIYGQVIDEDGSELGFDDFRISQMGPDGDDDFDAHFPAVAFNPDADEFLVVWEGDHDTDPDDIFPGPLVDDEFEIWGQRIDAAFPVVFVADPVRISDMGGTGDPDYDARRPDIVYNPVEEEYLVVWHGYDFASDDTEIFAQRLTGATAAQIGTNDAQISDMEGLYPDSLWAGFAPAVAYNGIDNEYYVVWHGYRGTDDSVEFENEIWGQRLRGEDAAEIGVNDLRISDIGPIVDPDRDALESDIAFSPVNREYLVVFRGDNNLYADDEFEIYVQYLDAATGKPTGLNDERISSMGDAFVDHLYDAFTPAVAANSTTGEFLVVWKGDDSEGSLEDDEYEIFGQRMLGLGELFLDGFESGNGCRWAPSEWFVCGP